AADPSRLELRHQVVRLKGTPKRLERGIACVRRYVHPGRLIGTIGPEVLMCIDDETHRMPPRGRNAPCGLCAELKFQLQLGAGGLVVGNDPFFTKRGANSSPRWRSARRCPRSFSIGGSSKQAG